jgi:hypothetical protein
MQFGASPEIPIGLEMCSLGPYCLPSFPPFGWRLWWGVPVLPAINTYSFLFSVVGLDSVLYSLDAPLFFVNNLLSPLRLAPWSSFLRNNLCALSEHMGRRRGLLHECAYMVLWKWGPPWLMSSVAPYLTYRVSWSVGDPRQALWLGAGSAGSALVTGSRSFKPNGI